MIEILPGDEMKLVSGPHWEAWQELGDFAADLAMRIQATPGAPKRFVQQAHELLEKHRELRPEQYGPRRAQ